MRVGRALESAGTSWKMLSDCWMNKRTWVSQLQRASLPIRAFMCCVDGSAVSELSWDVLFLLV